MFAAAATPTEKLVKRPDPKKNVMSGYYSQIENVVVPGPPVPSGFVPELYRDPEALYDFIHAGDTRRALATLEANAGDPAKLGAMAGLCRERSGMTLGKFSTSKGVKGTSERLAEIVESYKQDNPTKYTLFEMAYRTHAPTAPPAEAATASAAGAGAGFSRRTRNTRKSSRRNHRNHKRSSRSRRR
jgi:hypothetical protein